MPEEAQGRSDLPDTQDRPSGLELRRQEGGPSLDVDLQLLFPDREKRLIGAREERASASSNAGKELPTAPTHAPRSLIMKGEDDSIPQGSSARAKAGVCPHNHRGQTMTRYCGIDCFIELDRANEAAIRGDLRDAERWIGLAERKFSMLRRTLRTALDCGHGKGIQRVIAEVQGAAPGATEGQSVPATAPCPHSQ